MTKLSTPFKIGDVNIKNRLILAPMAGYTDVAMRKLCARYGAGLTVTEMVSAKGLCYSPDKCAPLLLTSEEESVKCVQLFGHEPEFFAKAISSPLLDKFDIIDINMGCPVPKIVKNGEGSALILSPELAEEIVAVCVKAAGGRPVTVKTRIGFYNEDNVTQQLCLKLVNAGAAAITLHGRTKEQGYSGASDWSVIESLAKFLPVPVIGSGDACADNAFELESKAAAIMIGRAAVGCPTVFARILGNESEISKAEILLEHFDLMTEYYGERYAHVNIRHHIGGYLRGCRGQKEVKLALLTASSHSKTREILLSLL